MTDCDVLVVGAGVSGLTTAICLAEQGPRVTVQAEAGPQRTTSSAAGALWGSHLAEPGGRTARWARQTLAVLRELAADPAAGVRIAAGVEAVRPPGPGADGGLSAAIGAKLTDLDGYTTCAAADLPAGFAHGWRYAAPLIHMPTYLGYLRARLERAGARLTEGTITSLAAGARGVGARAVVNCTGIGARRLVPDPQVTPVRGQIVEAANPGLSEFFVGHSDGASELVYVFPHGDTVVLGGTEGPGDWSLAPDPATAERILSDCAGIEPRLRGARVLAHRVGLRPFRPMVRLELTRPTAGSAADSAADSAAGSAGPVLVHNYGHGGGGVTLSWGCARECAGLLAPVLA